MAAINYPIAAAQLGYVGGYATVPDEGDYSTLTWMGTPIAQALLESTYLEMKRNEKIAEVSAAMGAEVISGFPSDAYETGVFRIYNSNIQDQVAIIGALIYCTPLPNIPAMGDSYTMSSIDPPSGVRGYHAHDIFQLRKLFIDLGVFSSDMIQRLTTMLGQVYAVNTGVVSADLDTIASFHWR